MMTEYIEVLTTSSTSVTCKVHGNSASTYDLVMNGSTKSNVQADATVKLTGLDAATRYTISLMGEAPKTLTDTIIVRNYQNNPLTLAEVQVFDTSGNNVARNGTATQSFTAWGGVASRGIDGNTSRWYSHGGQTHTSADYNQWWKLVLETPTEVDKIVVWNRKEAGLENRLTGSTVEIYDNNGIMHATSTLNSAQTQVIQL